MPKYNLGFTKKDDAITIDLTKIRKIESLEDLDDFTSMFKNEDELKIYLVKKGVLSSEFLSKNINVIYRHGGVYKKIPVLYLENKKYIDEEYVKNKLTSMTNDLDFLEKLANRMDARIKHNIQGTNIAAIRTHLINVKNGGDPLRTYDLLYSALTDMFFKAVTVVDKKTGEVKNSYRGLRDLGLFVSKYAPSEIEEINIDKIPETEEFEQITFGQIMNQTKTIKEKNDSDFVYPLDNQLYTQDGSPFFPPNSEEERIYKMHLEEEMSIEEHPHYRR
ncbi:MAG: hypothetical protein IJY25_00260 [Bacilli bacterium]|nr:hypothetical protein [Bacilli bacterium]